MINALRYTEELEKAGFSLGQDKKIGGNLDEFNSRVTGIDKGTRG